MVPVGKLIKSDPGASIEEEIKRGITKGLLKPGDKLLSEKEMSAFYNADLYSVRKALRSLKDSRVIESKPKSGFFISSSFVPEKIPVHSELGLKEVTFFTQSHLPLHRNMWDKIIRLFRQENPYVEIAVRYDKPDSVSDITEYGDPVRNYQSGNVAPLELKPFISKMNNNILNGNFMPLYFHAPCFFYNASLLKKAGLPLPEYSDFKGQAEYHKLISSAEKADGKCFQIGNMQPLMFMGQYLRQIQELIRSEVCGGRNSELENRIGELTAAVRDLYRNIYKNINMANSLSESFASQELAMFQGNTSQLGSAEFADLPFEWGIYPIFAVDDSAFKVPLNGAVSKETHDPLGSVRFLQFLQDNKAQVSFADAGCIPLRGEFLKNSMVLKRAGYASEIFTSAMDKADLFFYNSYNDFYISYRIVNTVLFDCILKDKEKQDAVSEIIRLGKVYLNIKEKDA